MIVDLDGGPDSAPGRDRRRAMALAFVMCLAMGSAGLGRDGPAVAQNRSASTLVFSRDGTSVVAADRWESQYLTLPSNSPGVVLSWIPDRLANEALPPLPFVPIRVRAVSGLAVAGVRDGDFRMITWSESGNVYWLVSDHGDVTDLVRLADSLR